MMLITKHFLLIRVPKTGGTFIATVSRRNLPSGWLVANDLHPHAAFADIPERFRALPMLCYVRNPWDWYVSWYHYLIENPPDPPHTLAGTPLWMTAFDRGRSSFRQAVTRACSGEDFQHRLTSPIMAERGIDHYSALHEAKTEPGIEAGQVEVGRFERLGEDYLAFLARHDVDPGKGFRHALADAPPLRQSARGDYRQYYDRELRELVAEKASAIIERYGYEF
jgi:hypothetical protein